MAKRKRSKEANPDERPLAPEWLMSHKQPELLPTWCVPGLVDRFSCSECGGYRVWYGHGWFP
jgi:hypothetical protein